MVNEDELRKIFSDTGKEYGYDSVGAEFMAFKEFKVRWQRSYRWAEFKVSDYLMDAPPTVLEGLAKSLFTKIAGLGKESYTDEMCEWITDPKFASDKQPIYVRRSRNFTRTTKGEHKDLAESYARLIAIGLVKEDPSIYITWADTPSRKSGSCSVLMKTVGISTQLDREDMPDEALDFCLYHELCHIIVGFDPDGDRHAVKFLELEAKYPEYKKAEEHLNRFCIYL